MSNTNIKAGITPREETPFERTVRVEKADAQALADMRTLDEWCKVSPQTRGVYFRGDTTVVLQRLDYAEPSCFDGSTPEAARAKAAAWVREQTRPSARPCI